MAYGHNKDFVVKDSGVRQEYKSGMRRDTQEGKPNYRLIDLRFLKRIAMHLVKGAVKYGRDNWRLANSPEELERFQDSSFRHLMQWLAGDEDEDHMAAVCFNLMAAEHVKAMMLAKTQKDEGVQEMEASKSPVDILKFMDTIEDAIPGSPNISWVVSKDSLTVYITWTDFKMSRKIDRFELETIYDTASLSQALCEDIWNTYQTALNKRRK